MNRNRNRNRQGASPLAGAGGAADPAAELDTLLATYTLDLNPIEANITKDVNDLVEQWDETGTVGGSYVQATEANKPLWEADGGNGKPCVTIQDTTDVMVRSVNASHNDYFSTSEMFLIAVCQNDLSAGGLDNIWSGSGGGKPLFARNGTGFRLGLNDGVLRTTDVSGLSIDTRYIVAMRHLGGNIGISINGGAWTAVTCGDVQLPDTDAAYTFGNIGSGANAGKYFRKAGRPTYPGDEDYAALVALLASVYEVTV